MKKIVLVFVVFVLYAFNTHIESIARCDVSETSTKVLFVYKIPIDKLMFLDVGITKEESVLDNSFLLQQKLKSTMTISVNDKEINLDFISAISDNNNMIITYSYLKDSRKVDKIDIVGDNIIKSLDSHASIDYWFYLNHKKRLFKLKQKQTSIHIKY